ncbi:MAG: PHP domain-containing protein [Chloroflexi bacterium]|nr:PHP domain-containing protein [Chloroflexota bacterium]
MLTIPEGYSVADLHLHTSVSDGMAETAEVLRYVQECTSLNVIAITDHDTIEGGLRARDLAARLGYRFEVIVGAEITTRRGHLLGLFLERDVPPLQPLAHTLQAIHEQGGLAVAPHPMSWLTFSLGQRSIERVLAAQEHGVYLDALEVVNASVAGRLVQGKITRLNRQRYGLAEVGSSDGHFLPHIGTGCTLFPGHTAEDLRQSLLRRQTQAVQNDAQQRQPIGVGTLLQQQFRSLIVLPSRSLRRPLRERIRGR